MLNDTDAKKLARLEGFQAGVHAMLEVVTGRKVTPPARQRHRGRPFGSRNRKPTGAVAINTGRKPVHKAA